MGRRHNHLPGAVESGFNLRWSDVGVGSPFCLSATKRCESGVLISVGATLGWEVPEHQRPETFGRFNLRWSDVGVGSPWFGEELAKQLLVLISVGATLGWEAWGAESKVVCTVCVLISVGATLGWEGSNDPSASLASHSFNLRWSDVGVGSSGAVVYDEFLSVLISVGATLGWEALRFWQRNCHLACSFNLRWSDVGVGSERFIVIDDERLVLISVGATLGWEAVWRQQRVLWRVF